MMNIEKPLLMAFEGIDGSGKTTVSKKLLDFLNENGHITLWFREPGDSPWGKKIRELANLEESIPKEEELNYFLEDRKWNVETNITPALKRGESVIVDRYYFSSACYQGARDGFDMWDIIKRNRVFAPEPEITFIIDVDVDTALTRIRGSRDVEAKLFEKKDFLHKVRANYLRLIDDPRVFLIDGSGTPDAVFAETRDTLLKRMGTG